MKPSRILSTLFLVAVASGAPVKRSDVNTLQAVNQEPNVTGVFSHPVAYYDPASKLPPLLSADEPAALYKVEPDWGNQFQVSSLDVTATTLTVSNSLVDADTVLDLTTASDPAGRPFKGIGVAFTDSALYELGLLSPEAQDAVMAASFGTSAGNGLSWSRFPIGSCDFSPTLDAPYNYLDGSTGTGLDQFTLTPKNPYGNTLHFDDPKEPLSRPSLYKKAKAVAASDGGRALQAFASPWSAPGWAKSAKGCMLTPAGNIGGVDINDCNPGGARASMSMVPQVAQHTYDVGYNGTCKGGVGSFVPDDVMVYEDGSYKYGPCDMYGGHLSGGPGCTGDAGCNVDMRTEYAQYLAKYVDVMVAEGVDMVALTVQNEPEGRPAITPWETTTYGVEELAEFAKILIAELDAANSMAQVWYGDSQVDFMAKYVESYGDKETSPRLQGVGTHWYVQGGVPNQLDYYIGGGPGKYTPNNQLLSAWVDSHTSRPASTQMLVATEACSGFSSFFAAALDIESWGPAKDMDTALKRAHQYARDVIMKLQAGYNLWMDWNLILDSEGGPNHAYGFTDAALLRGALGPSDGFGATPIYFFLGALSRYLPLGGTVLAFGGQDQSTYSDGTTSPPLPAVAVQSGEQTVVAVLNTEIYDKTVSIKVREGSYYHFTIKARGIATLVLKKDA